MKPMLQTENGICYVCGAYCKTHKHHIFGGANRKLSEQYGMYVYLCPGHHNMSDQSVHFNKEMKRWLQSEGQDAFEKIYGHNRFMEVFGKNYMEEA